MAQIKTLVEKSGEQILPRTRVEAITLSDGTTNLEDFLITFEEGQLAADLNFDATSLNTSTWADVKEDIIPSTSELNLGSAAKPWKELYLSSSSLHLGDVKLSTETGSLVVANATTGDPIPVDAATLNGFTSDDFATPQYVQDQVSGLVDAAPSTLNTLNELAAALGDDANYAATVTSALGQKAPINNPTFTGTVSGVSAAMVGLGNVTNESKTTMFNNPIFTGSTILADGKIKIVNCLNIASANTWYRVAYIDHRSLYKITTNTTGGDYSPGSQVFYIQTSWTNTIYKTLVSSLGVTFVSQVRFTANFEGSGGGYLDLYAIGGYSSWGISITIESCTGGVLIPESSITISPSTLSYTSTIAL